MIRRGLLLLLLGAPAARATLPLLESGCTLTPVVQPATPAPPPAPGPGGRPRAPPGTCYVDAADRLIPQGVTGCAGQSTIPPLALKPPLTCDSAKMTPELCAAACLEVMPKGVAAIGVEFATECCKCSRSLCVFLRSSKKRCTDCAETWPVEKAGKPKPLPAAQPEASCGTACTGDPL